MTQLNLFNDSNDNKSCVNKNEAPNGFYAESKDKSITSNCCNSCDAKALCLENKNNWCLKNRCMSYSMTAFQDGKIYNRKDGQSVIFKRL